MSAALSVAPPCLRFARIPAIIIGGHFGRVAQHVDQKCRLSIDVVRSVMGEPLDKRLLLAVAILSQRERR
jgi:hypothetical protein